MKDYDQFTEEMVRYFLEHQEYQEDLLYLDQKPKLKRKFVTQLFRYWLQDPTKLDWYVAHLISQISRV